MLKPSLCTMSSAYKYNTSKKGLSQYLNPIQQKN